jgi:hypothetical protein
MPVELSFVEVTVKYFFMQLLRKALYAQVCDATGVAKRITVEFIKTLPHFLKLLP